MKQILTHILSLFAFQRKQDWLCSPPISGGAGGGLLSPHFGGSWRGALPLIVLMLFSCDKQEITYSGPDYVQWADSLTTLPVVDDEEVFDIRVSAMNTSDRDRNVAVELIADKSNAIQGHHFDLLTHTAVIPAGSRTASVRVRAYNSHLEANDSIGFILRLLIPESTVSPLYGTETRVMLQKAKRFDINDFTGYAVVQSTWMYYYMTPQERLFVVEKDKDVENRIILRDLYYDNYDVRLDLTSDNILEPKLHFETQVFAPTTEAFGTIYGNGKIMMDELAAYVSYYSSLEKFICFYTNLYVTDVGTVGDFVHLIYFVSDEEAKKLLREGIDHSQRIKNKV